MRVTFYATLRQLIGGRSVDLALPPGGTARDLLDLAATTYPALTPLVWTSDGGLRDYIKVFVDGRETTHLGGVAAVIPRDATVDIFLPVAGG
jgi:sulfur-carrier protein